MRRGGLREAGAGYARSDRRGGFAVLAALSAVLLLGLTVGSAQAGLDRTIEKTLGKQARDSIESQYEVVKDGAAPKYIERLGAELVAVSPRQDLAYSFKIVDSEQVNAFALPWGYVYVTTGMLRFVDSSDQLAGVVAHEVAHVTERHSVDAFKEQFWTSLAFGVIRAPTSLLAAGRVGATLFLLRHSRKDEQAADRLGAGYAYRAGYDPSQLGAFLRKLEEQKGRDSSAVGVYLSTHPTEARRQQRLAELPETRPDSPEAVMHLAHGCLARHLANQAVVEYRRAIKLAPNSAALYSGLTRAYAELGETTLARQAQRRATTLGATDGGEAATLLAASATAPVAQTSPASRAELEAAEETRIAADTWRLELAAPARQIHERAKSLDSSVEGLARRMGVTSSLGVPSVATGRVLEKAQAALYMIAETSDRVRAIGDGLDSTGASAAEVAGLVERGVAAPAVTGDRAQWQALLGEVKVGVERATEQATAAGQQALRAADLASKAVSPLNSALAGLPSSMDPFGGPERGFAFLSLAQSEVDAALKNANDALEMSRKAMAATRGWRAQQLSWRLSAAYLEAPLAQRPALRRMVAAMMGADGDGIRIEGSQGFGSALLQLAAAPAAPAKAAVASKPVDGASKPAAAEPDSGHGDLMLKLILADVQREDLARKEWQGSGAAPPAAAQSAAGGAVK